MGHPFFFRAACERSVDSWENGYGFFFALARDIPAGNWPVFHVPLYPIFSQE
jgi:hypothetical protein